MSKEKIEVCTEAHHHRNLKNTPMPAEDILYRLADLFKVFGDPTRIRILYKLSEQELCVCDIAEVLEMTQSAISHQLRILKQMSLVKFRRREKRFTIPLLMTMWQRYWLRDLTMSKNSKLPEPVKAPEYPGLVCCIH